MRKPKADRETSPRLFKAAYRGVALLKVPRYNQAKMTKKQAREKAIESIHRIGLVFNHNNCECKELFAVIQNERAVLGFGRLMVQAAWMTNRTDGIYDLKFRDVAYHLLFQCYLKQKPKRKTKAKK